MCYHSYGYLAVTFRTEILSSVGRVQLQWLPLVIWRTLVESNVVRQSRRDEPDYTVLTPHNLLKKQQKSRHFIPDRVNPI